MNDTYRMKHFTPGKEVWYNGYYYPVDHVLVRGMDLYVRLEGILEPVHSNALQCEPTKFTLKRVE